MSITTDLMDFPKKTSRSFFIEEELKGVNARQYSYKIRSVSAFINQMAFLEKIEKSTLKCVDPVEAKSSLKFDKLPYYRA